MGTESWFALKQKLADSLYSFYFPFPSLHSDGVCVRWCVCVRVCESRVANQPGCLKLLTSHVLQTSCRNQSMAGWQIVPSIYSDKQISAKMLLAAYQMCWALWYGTADEKLSTSHLCFAATIGAAICAEQSSANSQPDYMCHNVRHKNSGGGGSHRRSQICMSAGEDGTGCRWLNRTRRGQVREEGKANRSRKNKFILISKHMNCVSCEVATKSQTPFSYFSPSHLPPAQSVAFRLQLPSRLELATAGVWHEQANLYLTSHLPIDTHTPRDWRPHAGVTSPSWVPCQCNTFLLSLSRARRQARVWLWVNERDESGETRLLKSSWRMLCIGADDSEPARLADRKKDNCRREMSTSTLRGRDIPDLLSVITPQTYLACSAL